MTMLPGEDDPYFPGEPRPMLEDDREAQRIRDEKHELRLAGLRRCMEQAWFREWLMEKLLAFNTFGQTFAVTPGGFPDPHSTFYHAGMKAAGWALWEELDNLSPELASTMRREALQTKS